MTPGVATSAAFHEWTGRPPAGVWRAPGRVNLIGEHTDYNAGLVLPFAIDRATDVAAARGAGATIRCRSTRRTEIAEVSLGALLDRPAPTGGWADYVFGVAWALARAGVDVAPADLLVDSTLPEAAGLLSSAALEVAVALVLLELSGVSLPAAQVAVVAHDAETGFVGVPSGPMDQVAVATAAADHAVALDCRSGSSVLIPFAPEGAGLVVAVVDTGVRRGLRDGRYAERRRECDDAARALGLASLRDASADDVDRSPALDGPLRARARHVVSENRRVERVTAQLVDGGVASIGPALLESHASLRDDFEVSCTELDLAVETAMDCGAMGARMTGAGFGGSALVLLPAGHDTELATRMADRFREENMAAVPATFTVKVADGARRIA